MRQFLLSVVAKPGVHRREAGWGPRISKTQSRHSNSCLKRPPVRQLHDILIMRSTKIPHNIPDWTDRIQSRQHLLSTLHCHAAGEVIFSTGTISIAGFRNPPSRLKIPRRPVVSKINIAGTMTGRITNVSNSTPAASASPS